MKMSSSSTNTDASFNTIIIYLIQMTYLLTILAHQILGPPIYIHSMSIYFEG